MGESEIACQEAVAREVTPMITETLSESETLVIRRTILEPGETSPWHSDACRRFTVVVRGSQLKISYRDSAEVSAIAVSPGFAEWDEPESRVHQAVNAGTDTYEEVVTFFRDSSAVVPQPEFEGPAR